MATDLTFIDELNIDYEGWQPGDKIESKMAFYSATPSDTQAVHRFVGKGSRTKANGGHLEFDAITADTGIRAGVLIGHLHDDPTKEFNDVVAVGKQARVIVHANQPVWIECASDLSANLSHPGVAVSAAAGGYAQVAANTHRLMGRTVGGGDGVGWKTVGSKYFVAVMLSRDQPILGASL